MTEIQICTEGKKEIKAIEEELKRRIKVSSVKVKKCEEGAL